MKRQLQSIPKVLQKEDITIAIDTREQAPYRFPDFNVTRIGLATGDYSVVGLTDEVAIERKELSDFVGCCGKGRERFEREIQRLLAYQTRAVVIEATWKEIKAGQWRSMVSPKAVYASILAWMAWGLPFILAGTRGGGREVTEELLWRAATRRHKQLRGLHGNTK